jgi:hypothetical protein
MRTSGVGVPRCAQASKGEESAARDTRSLNVRLTFASILGLCALALCGCGGSSSSSDTVPAELIGTYTTTLEQSDIPANASPALEAGEWKLVIATSGAPDGGPALSIKPSTQGNALEAPGLTVDGDTLKLEQEECEQKTGYVFYDNEYSWKLDASTLTLTTVKNDCPDRVAETILTSHPWTKQP